MRKSIALTLVGIFSCIAVPVAWASELIFEQRIESTRGAPTREIYSFDATGLENLVLRVENGAPDGSRRVSSAVITMNEIQILRPSDLNQKVDILERPLAPRDGSNTLSINLRSNPGGFLLVQVLGEMSLNLPPDPGSDGDTTLEGTDVNENGVRDDVERWIGLTYRNSQKARQALIQAYFPLQGFVLHADQGDRDAVYDDMTALQRAGECMNVLFGEEGYEMRKELKARVLNTSERVQAYRQASRMIGGGSFPGRPLSRWKESCTFDPDAMDN